MKKYAKVALVCAACGLTLSLTGCGEKVTGVTMNVPEDKLERGSQVQIAAAYDYNKDTSDAKAASLIEKLDMSYTSSDTTVLTVDENGQVTAVGKGMADVILSSKDESIYDRKSFWVVVNPTSFTMEDEIQMSMDHPEAQLTISLEPEDATQYDVIYTSADESIVTVSEDGKLTAVGAGKTTVNAEIASTDLKRDCKITVLPSVEEINLSNTNVSMGKNGTKQLSYTVTPENADISSATWSSSDESVVTVDGDGKITAVADGEGEITLTIGNVSVGCKVTVATKKAASASNSSTAAGSSSGAASSGGSSDSSGASQGADSSASGESASGRSGHGYWTVYGDGDAYRAINALRVSLGLNELAWDGNLGDVAAARCRAIMEDFSHNGMTAPEIIAMGYPDGASVVAGWQGSSTHYAQMTYEGYTSCAVVHIYDGDGCHYWCACFG